MQIGTMHVAVLHTNTQDACMTNQVSRERNASLDCELLARPQYVTICPAWPIWAPLCGGSSTTQYMATPTRVTLKNMARSRGGVNVMMAKDTLTVGETVSETGLTKRNQLSKT